MADAEGPDQVEAEHIARLGPDLGPLYHALWTEYVSLVVKWQEYREAFGTSEERVDLLNSAAGLFFRIVQDTLWHDTLLHLCRLTDPPESVGRPNLALGRLPQMIADATFRGEVATLVDQAVASTAFARDWRNRHLGHTDLALALNQGAHPLRDASRQQVVDALTAIHAVLNRVSERLLQVTLAPEVIAPLTGAVTLMRLLRDGIGARDARRERIRRGEPLPEDFPPKAV